MNYIDVPARFVDYVSGIADGAIDPVMGTYPDLDDSRWFDNNLFGICSELERNFPALQREIGSIPLSAFYPESERSSVPRNGDWRIFQIYAMGEKESDNARHVPTAVALAESLGAVTTMSGGVLISRLPAGAAIHTHRGPTNTRVRCHLGIQIPVGDCAIEVDGEARTWVEGQCLVLNDHLPHRVWNRTNSERIVLIIDLWHPALTGIERALLSGIQVYTQVQFAAMASWHADRNAVRQAITRD
jgi:aspartate beta-hydroxylase